MGWLWGIIGLVVGANLGVVTMCLFICGKEREADKELVLEEEH